MKNGKEFAEKMFSEVESNNNEVQEKLYSTGNDELDNLLEKAYNEGYEAAQKEFSKKDPEEGKNHRGLGRAAYIGKVGGVAGRMAGKRATNKALEEGEKVDAAEEKGKKKAVKVGAGVNAGITAAKVGAAGAVARKVVKDNKGAIKEALEGAGIKLTKKNKRAAMVGAAALAAGNVAASAGLGALGAKEGVEKNNSKRREKIYKKNNK